MALSIRADVSADELRALARRETNGRVSSRLLGIANALDGMSRIEAARAAGMDRQTLCDWVQRYNTECIAGLRDKPKGRPPQRLSEGEQASLANIIFKGPDPETDAVSTVSAASTPSFAVRRFPAMFASLRLKEGGEMEDVRLDGRLQARNEAGDYRRIEVITGRRHRRDWSDEEKTQILMESALPGASVSAVARRHGVNRGLLTVWRRQAGLIKRRGRERNTLGDAATFVPLEIVSGTDAGAVACQASRARIEVELRGGRIVIDGDIDPHLAAAVVAVVRSRP